MAYQSVASSEGMPLSCNNRTVEVVDESAGSIDEVNGIRMETSRSRMRSRKGAALSLFVLAVGAVSALSAMGGRTSPQTSGAATTTNLASEAVISSEVAARPQKERENLSDLSDEDTMHMFNHFVNKFEKSYKDDDEKMMRVEIFKRNLKRIDELNANSLGARYEVSVWADLTQTEFKSYQTYGKVSDKAKAHAKANTHSISELAATDTTCQACSRFPELSEYITGDLPTFFDWRQWGAVTEVKNQAYCGSCWSFSTTGCVEGAWYLAGHVLDSLSEQQLVTCDTEWNQGCNGGWPSLAMMYIEDNGGIVPELIYPYRKVMMDGPNAHDPVCADVVKDGNYAATLSVEIAVAEGAMDEDAMARWLVLNGPLSVALDAVGMDYYSDGIDMGEYCTPLEIDHAVLIVGFGEENGVKYWTIKNSWAIWWGERGYYRLVRGTNACGIADDVTAVIIGDATVDTKE